MPDESFSRLEQLEPRVLLSASITQKKGLLTVNCDDAADNVSVIGHGPGVVEIDVNGASQQFDHVKNVVVNGGDGADRILAWDVNIKGTLTLNGQGDNDVLLIPLVTGGEMNCAVVLNGGDGDDLLFFDRTIFNKGVTMIGGDGDDDCGGEASQFHGALKIDMGTGDDVVFNQAVFFGPNTYFKGVTVNLGAGQDLYQEVRGIFKGALVANGGTGFDTFDNDMSVGSGKVTLKQFETLI